MQSERAAPRRRRDGFAFLALCVRTLEEGFQPGTEIERMRQHRLSHNRSFARFKRAEADPQERFEAMMDVENAALEECCRSSKRTRRRGL